MSKLTKILGATTLVAALGFAGATFAADLSDISGAMITDSQMPTFVIGTDAQVSDVLSAIDVAAVLANVKETNVTTAAGTVEYSVASGTASNTKIETPDIGTSKAFSDIALSNGKISYTKANGDDKQVEFKTYVSVDNTTTGYDSDNGIKASVAVKNFKYVIDFTKTTADGVTLADLNATAVANKEINIFGGTYTLESLTASDISFSPGQERTVGEGETITICGKTLKFTNICCDCYGGYGGVQVTDIATGVTVSVASGDKGSYGSFKDLSDLKLSSKEPIEAAKTADGKGSITIKISDKNSKITLTNGLTYDSNLKEDTNGKYYVNFNGITGITYTSGYLKNIVITTSQSFGGDSYESSNAVIEGGSINFPKGISKLLFSTNEASLDKTDVVITSSRDSDINKARVHLKFTTSNNVNIDQDVVVQNVTSVDTPVYVAALNGDIYRFDTKVNNSNTNQYFLKYSKISYSDTVTDNNEAGFIADGMTVNATSNGKIDVTYAASSGVVAYVKDNMGTIYSTIDGGNVNITVTDKNSKNATVVLNSINSTTGDKVASMSLNANSVDKDKSKRTSYGTIATRASDSATVTLFKEQIKANIRVDATDASFDSATCSLIAGAAGGCAYSGTYTAKADDKIGDSSCATCKLIKINSVGAGAAPTKVATVSSVAQYDTAVSATSPTNNMVVIGGTAINRITAALENKSYPSYGADSGLTAGQYKVKMVTVGDYNALIIEGYEKEQTRAAAVAVINAIKGVSPMSGPELAGTA